MQTKTKKNRARRHIDDYLDFSLILCYCDIKSIFRNVLPLAQYSSFLIIKEEICQIFEKLHIKDFLVLRSHACWQNIFRNIDV